MYLVLVRETFFPEAIRPVISYHQESTRDDAYMKARCLRDEAKAAKRGAVIEIHRLDESSRLHQFHTALGRPTRKRGNRR